MLKSFRPGLVLITIMAYTRREQEPGQPLPQKEDTKNMCIENKLGKILLLIISSILASCSDGDMGASPSLNADDIWDQMAEERQKPLPVNKWEDDSGENLSDLSLAPKTEPFLPHEIAAYRLTLQAAAEKFHMIKTDLETELATLAQETATAEGRKIKWRTMQLYLSRLSNLHNNMDAALNVLGDNDQTLVENGRELSGVLADYIARIWNRVHENN